MESIELCLIYMRSRSPTKISSAGWSKDGFLRVFYLSLSRFVLRHVYADPRSISLARRAYINDGSRTQLGVLTGRWWSNVIYETSVLFSYCLEDSARSVHSFGHSLSRYDAINCGSPSAYISLDHHRITHPPSTVAH